jgi:lipopolysaccharide transport system permease protein
VHRAARAPVEHREQDVTVASPVQDRVIRPTHDVVIEAETGLGRPSLRELWDARDLVRLLVRRDVAVRYRQTAVGALWAIIQPLALAAVFSVFLGRLARVPSPGDIPYPLFALSGMVMWLYIQQAFSRSSESTVAAGTLISKVYFPRLAIPIVAVLSPAVDFFVASGVLLVVMTAYGHPPGLTVLAIPLVFALAMATTLGIGLWFSSLAVRYRDVQHVVPFLTQVALFITPIVYSFELIPEQLRPLYALNPLVGVMEAWRWAIFGRMSAPPALVLVPITVSVVLIVSGSLVFRRAERSFADYL